MDERQAAQVLRQLQSSGSLTPEELKTVVGELRNRGEQALSSRLLEELCTSGRVKATDLSTLEHMGTVRLETAATESVALVSLGERFRDVTPLGFGGMGKVFHAFDTLLERPVAIKVLRSRGAGLSALLAEARAQARVEHENVCPIYDVLEQGEQGVVVMRLIPGKSLDHYVGKLKAEEVAMVGVQVARALHVAHQQGLVHRDVKPANILLEEGDQGLRASVVDFGLSVESGKGELAGTPGFLAPEVVAGVVDRRADIFGLGASLYYILAGKPAQAASSLFELLLALKEGSWSPPPMPNPPFPEDLAWILGKAMAPDPEDRYPSAQELALDLERFLRGEPVTARPGTLPYWLREWWFHHRRRLGLWILVAMLVGVLGVAVSVVLQQKKQAELASRLQVELLTVEERYRSSLMKPPHDISYERAQLRQALEQAGKQAAEAGLAQESLLVLLGRAHLALGNTDKAVSFLEQAASKPRTPPVVQGLLGTALMRQWQEEFAQVAQLPQGEARLAREKVLQELQKRAQQLLASASGTTQETLAKAQLAYLNGHWQEAVDLALASRGQTPWAYELELFVGETRLAWARELFDQGRYQEAENLLRQAQESFQRAAELAPSHPEALLGLAQALFEQANCRGETGGAPELLWEKARAVAEQVLQVDREQNRALYLATMAHLRTADHALRRGLRSEAERELAATLRRAEELQVRAPDRAWGLTLAGIAWRLRGQLGSSPDEQQSALVQARRDLEKALEKDPGDSLAANNLGLLLLHEGFTLWQRGQWSEEALGKAEALFRKLTDTFSSNTLLVNLSAVAVVRAHALLLNSQDPGLSLEVASTALGRALENNAADTVALNNSALVFLERAQHSIHRGQKADDLLQQAGALLARVAAINEQDPLLPDNQLRRVALSFQALEPGEGGGAGLWDEATRWRGRVVDWEENPESQGWWAAVLWEMGRWEGGVRGRARQREAWRVWRKAYGKLPDHPDLALFWCAWRLAEGKPLGPQEKPMLEKLQRSPYQLLRMGSEELLRIKAGTAPGAQTRGALWALASAKENMGRRQP